MNLKLDSVLTGRTLAGVVIFLAVVSAIVGAVGARSGGFDLFLARLLPPLAVGILIVGATATLKGVMNRQGTAALPAAGRTAARVRWAAPNRAGEAARATLRGLRLPEVNLRFGAGNIAAEAADQRDVPSTASSEVSMPAGASSGFADAFPSFVRFNVAGIGSSILGVLCAWSVFMPWGVALVAVGRELETQRFTLRMWAEEGDDRTVYLFFVAVLVLGIGSIASVVLPRLVVALIAAGGLAVTVVSQFYLLGQFDEAASEFIELGIRAELAPDRGTGVAAFSFLVILLLQLIPTLNAPMVQRNS